MKIAIIGAGFCGLSLAYLALSQKNLRCQVTLFDHKGIGRGASGVAAGLLHPYPGEQGRRSWMATEGLVATKNLLEVVATKTSRPVASYEGIIRVAQNEEQVQAFLSHMQIYQDVEQLDEHVFLIRSGITVHCHHYLQGLWELIQEMGGVCVQTQITTLNTLDEYDSIVLASGSGTALFEEAKKLKVKRVKGQVLSIALADTFLQPYHSVIGKGYLALGDKPGHCYLGSTYEKHVISEEVDCALAKQLILSKMYPASSGCKPISPYFPSLDQFKIMGCRAGVRLSRQGDYRPIAEQLSSRIWALTAMGSRGLLYHAYLAQQLLTQLM